MRTLLAGGRAITAEGDQRADIWIEGGRITAIGSAPGESPDRIIDASGKYVLPGCVDVHTHMDLALVGNFDPDEEQASEFESESTADDFASGAIAAAYGGTTTIVDFAEQAPGQTLEEGIATWHSKLARARPIIDVGFHLIIRDLGTEPSVEVARLVEDGVTSLKLFMAYKGDLMVDDGTLWDAMQLGSEHGALIMVHAE